MNSVQLSKVDQEKEFGIIISNDLKTEPPIFGGNKKKLIY